MRIVAAAALLFLAAAPALADPTREQVMRGAERCEGIGDNRAWLDCFYGSAQPMRSLLGLAPAPVTQTRLVPPPSQVPPRPAPMTASAPPPPPSSGGWLGGLLEPGKPLVRGQRMTSYAFNKDGSFIIALADGQMWKQNSPPFKRASWDRPASSYIVDIREGVMGSDNMTVRGDPVAYKVHRTS